MNLVPSFQLSRLAFGVSRISIRPKTSKWKQKRARGPGPSGQPEGHGRILYVFNHIEANHTVYSFKRGLRRNPALKQLPFLGKKSKPAKLRKDYWRMMAMVEFPRGQSAVGLSIYQKLREFRVRHELEWGSRAKDLLRMSKPERMAALKDQKATAVADLAAVLSGAGKGNKMWISPGSQNGEQLVGSTGDGAAQPGEEQTQGQVEPAAEGEEARPAEAKYQGPLHPVTIFWSNDIDQSLAKQWSDNVQHYLLETSAEDDPIEGNNEGARTEEPVAVKVAV